MVFLRRSCKYFQVLLQDDQFYDSRIVTSILVKKLVGSEHKKR